MIRQSGSLLTVLLTALVLWAPLPFGGATPWAAAILEVLCFTALTLAAAAARPAALRAVLLPAAALVAVALLAVAQSLAWPSGLVTFLSPQHAALYGQASSLPGVPPIALHLSLAPAASRAAALLWAAAAAALLAGAAAGQHRGSRRWLAAALITGSLFQVFFGAQEQVRGSRTLWGVDIPVSPRLHGTFVNPNHLALYLEMGLAVAFAWGWWAARRTRDEPQIERRLLLLAGPAVVWLTLFVGLALTGSRGGLLGALVGVTAQGVVASGVAGGARAGSARRRWRTALLGLGAAVAGLLVVLSLVGLRIGGLARLLVTQGDVGLGARLTEYRAVLRLWQRFPVLGAGLGSFADAFPLVQPAVLVGTWWHAHSDVLELLATAGALGLFLAAAGLAALIRRLLKILNGPGRSEDRAAALALLGACTAVTLHELVDFGLTMPANAVTLAALAGAASAVEAVRRRAVSAEPHGTRHDAPAADALDLEKVEAGPQRQTDPQRARRPRRKRAKKLSVEP
jgi:O-antigen ligase